MRRLLGSAGCRRSILVAIGLLLAAACLPIAAAVSASTAPYAYAADEPALLFRIEHALPSDPDRPRHAVRISRIAVERAIASRRLPVQLPDGQRYVLAVEREETADTGDLTLIARIDGALGRQSAVITLGSHAVFGVLPTPDGRVYQLSTRRGVSVLEPAAGIRPLDLDDASISTDVLAPPHASRTDEASATSGKESSAAPSSRRFVQAATAVGEVEVDVLGVYASNLVSLNGSVQAAETEFVNQIAVSNQAYLDSGTVVRLRLVAMRESDIASAAMNLDVLYNIQANNLSDGLDVHALRDSTAADLVAVLRPHADGDGSCGIAWLSGWDLNPTQADAEYGYSVNNVGSVCGPYVMAHEFGHNLGSHHDVETALAGNSGSFGAYPYSYGYRQDGPPNFATVMAYQKSWQQTWLGQFSRPDTTACQGVACGVAEQADNVRSLNQMAPRIARFRDPPGTISVLDAIALEGDDGSRHLSFSVRLSSPAPAGGVSFDIATVDGTALAGSDYQAKSVVAANIAAGQRSYEFTVSLVGDTAIEPEESLRVRLRNVVGAVVFDDEAVGVIRDDDSRVTLSGRVTFMADTSVPTSAFPLRVRSSDGELTESTVVNVEPPLFRYQVDIREENRVWLEVDSPPQPYLALREDLGVLRQDTSRDIRLLRRLRVRGQVRFPAGETPPQTMIEVVAMGMEGVSYQGETLYAFPPDFAYEFDSKPDVDVWMGIASPPAPFQPLDKVELGRLQEDRQHDLSLDLGSVVSGKLRFSEQLGPPMGPVGVSLSWASGFWKNSSANVYPPDYRFALAVPPGERIRLIAYNALPYGQPDLDLGTVSGDVSIDVDMPLAPVLSIPDVRIVEGHGGQSFAVLRLELSHAALYPWVYLQTEDGSALAGEDYVATSARVSFGIGETSKEFVVPILGDSLAEADEFFAVRVSTAYGLEPEQRVATVTVLNDDGGAEPLMLWVGDAAFPEGSVGFQNQPIHVHLSRPAPDGGVEFKLSARSESATAGVDFTSFDNQVVRIAAGEVRKQVPMAINGDAVMEHDEAFSLHLSEVRGAVAARNDSSVVILNDDLDAPPQVVNDHYAVARDQTLAVGPHIGVLANDIASDRACLKAYYFLGTPSHGRITWNTNGSFSYTPDPGYLGNDRLLYSAGCIDYPNAPMRTGKVDFSVVDQPSSADQYLWLVPPASNEQQQGFIRLSNRESASGTASVFGIDTVGRRSSGTITLTLGPKQSTHFNSQDLELGNTTKGLSGNLGAGEGNWMLVVRSELDIDALAYIRTPDGFVTSMHDRVEGDGVDWVVPLFNPASNPNQVSRLRVVNSTLAPIDVQIVGIDDAGQAGQDTITTTLPPLASREYDATDLEQGNTAKGLIGHLGDGEGKWRLTVSASDRITVQSLLADPMGYLTNLSTFSTSAVGDDQVLWMVTPGDETQQQGFLRVTNLSDRGGTLTLWGVDDRGQRSPGTATLALGARATQHLNSQDLEHGNTAKGLSGSLGNGEGDWRIFLSTDLDLLPMGLIRTPNGFVTTMHDLVLETARTWRVPMFNPGSNPNQVSVLRVVNPGTSAVNVSIAGVDDAGRSGPGGTASFTLAANAAVEFTAQELEQGSAARGLVGSLGDGDGKWWLQVSANAEVKVISMLRDPNGYLTNLSNETRGGADQLDP